MKRNKRILSAILAGTVALGGGLMLSGCKKEEPAVVQPNESLAIAILENHINNIISDDYIITGKALDHIYTETSAYDSDSDVIKGIETGYSNTSYLVSYQYKWLNGDYFYEASDDYLQQNKCSKFDAEGWIDSVRWFYDGLDDTKYKYYISIDENGNYVLDIDFNKVDHIRRSQYVFNDTALLDLATYKGTLSGGAYNFEKIADYDIITGIEVTNILPQEYKALESVAV